MESATFIKLLIEEDYEQRERHFNENEEEEKMYKGKIRIINQKIK